MQLQSAVDAYAAQQRLTVVAIAASRRAWSIRNVAALTRTLATLMERAAANASSATSDMLAEQGIDAVPDTRVVPSAFAATASDGRSLTALLEQAKTSLELDRMAWTQVADAGRAAQSVEIVVRPQVDGYRRMLNPPSCSRCLVLAGAFYRWNEGFERHPQCDCIHVPAQDDSPHDLTTNPSDYFDSLTREQQDATFTKAGAQAIRDGADISQVVNARRGMATATVFGLKGTVITREGITKRSAVGKRLAAKGGRAVRLMPESIYDIADDREDALRLLRFYGYVT